METNDPVVENEMQQIAEILKKTSKLRRTKSQISSFSGLIILLLIVFLALDITTFIGQYNTQKVLDEVQSDLPDLMDSQVMKNLINSIKMDVLPKYIDELSASLKDYQPLIEEECYEVIESIKMDTGPALQNKFVNDFEEILTETQVMLRERHPDLSETEITFILNTLLEEVQQQYPERINDQVTMMYNDINSSLDGLRSTEIFSELSEKNTLDLERILLTTALELMIYELDPETGDLR